MLQLISRAIHTFSKPREVAPDHGDNLKMHTIPDLDEAFALYRRPSINLVHVPRRLPFLPAIAKFEGTFDLISEDVPLKQVKNALDSELSRSGFAGKFPREAALWAKDMELIARAHAQHTGKEKIKVVLRTLSADTITDKSKWYFAVPHIDNLPSNAAVGYLNYGPDYYDNAVVNRNAALRDRYAENLLAPGAEPTHTGTGDLLIMKGDVYGSTVSQGAAHRSPPPGDPARPYNKRVLFLTY